MLPSNQPLHYREFRKSLYTETSLQHGVPLNANVVRPAGSFKLSPESHDVASKNPQQGNEMSCASNMAIILSNSTFAINEHINRTAEQTLVLELEARLAASESAVFHWKEKYESILQSQAREEYASKVPGMLSLTTHTIPATSINARPLPSLRSKYERLINLTLSARREARDWRKLAVYWESRARTGEARLDDSHSVEPFTPSPSDMPCVSEETLTPERADVLESLLRRRRGDWNEVQVIRDSVLERIGDAMQIELHNSESFSSTSASTASLYSSHRELFNSTAALRFSKTVETQSANEIGGQDISRTCYAAPRSAAQSRPSADSKNRQHRSPYLLRSPISNLHSHLLEEKALVRSMLNIGDMSLTDLVAYV
jgi:hypothetical protein